jgi:proline dehydrogenase
LNAEGKLATLDVLGEEVRSEAEAAEIVRAYLEALAAIERHTLGSGVSVKPTALGLTIDRELCLTNLETVVRAAAERERFVRIDMEDSSTTGDTLGVYRELRGRGLDNVGVVLQARLHRTLDDAQALAELRPDVRLCKGIYLEPEAVAYQDDREVGESFVRVAEVLLDAGSRIAFATHAERLIQRARLLVRDHGKGPGAYEFQLLLGVRPELGDRLVAEGERVRIYVPYGRRWYEYSLRRLQENPRMATLIARDLLRRPSGR